jgi:hypothetical protein
MRRILVLISALLALTSPAYGAVAFDAVSNVAEATGELSWTHTPVGTPRAAIVTVVGNSATDPVTSVTYGGTSMTEATGSPVLNTDPLSGEPGSVAVFFLGASIPTGAQTVVVTVNGAAVKRAVAVTLTATTDTEVVDTSTLFDDATGNPSVTANLGGRTCFVMIGFHSGSDTPAGFAPTTGWTSRLEHDFTDTGLQGAGWYTYDTIDTADVASGYTASANDVALISVAVSEVAASVIPKGGLLGVLP